MPLRATGINKAYYPPMESALVEGLSKNYTVYAGKRVEEKVNEIFNKVSLETGAGQECDDTKCLQNIAIEFQAELVATTTILKDASGFFLSLNVVNVLEDMVLFSKSETCRGCDEISVIEILKTLPVEGQTNSPVATKAPQQKGTLKVYSNPSTASSTVRNFSEEIVASGTTPFEAELNPGKYILTITKDGFSPFQKTVTIKAGKLFEITSEIARLKKLGGLLKVTTEPTGASIFVKNSLGIIKHSGETPSETYLMPGKYKITVGKAGYSFNTLDIEITDGMELTPAVISLRKQEGKLTVVTEPYENDAKVYVDGELKGDVQTELLIASGKHLINVKGKVKQGEMRIAVADESTIKLTIPIAENNIASNPSGQNPEYSFEPIIMLGATPAVQDNSTTTYGIKLMVRGKTESQFSSFPLQLRYSRGFKKANISSGIMDFITHEIFIGPIFEGATPYGLYFSPLVGMMTAEITLNNSSGKKSGLIVAGEVGYLAKTQSGFTYGLGVTQSLRQKITINDKEYSSTISELYVQAGFKW
jgi:hypothetical protein